MDSNIYNFIDTSVKIGLGAFISAFSSYVISKRTLVLLRNEHKIHYHKIESRILYSLEDIREFEDNCKK